LIVQCRAFPTNHGCGDFLPAELKKTRILTDYLTSLCIGEVQVPHLHHWKIEIDGSFASNE